MNVRPIAVMALMLTTLTGAAHAAAPVQETEVKVAKRVEATRKDEAAAEKEYLRALANYRKDQAAYEADPTIWTAELPVMPVKPANLKVPGVEG